MWLNIKKGAAMTRTEIEKALYKFGPAITMNLTEIAKARKKSRDWASALMSDYVIAEAEGRAKEYYKEDIADALYKRQGGAR